MGANYFTPENAWRHLFFVTGQTADEFYTDGGMRLNIEQLTFIELRRSGYERIIFYDKDNKLYCYDDDSYALMRVTGKTRPSGNGETPAQQEDAPAKQRRGGLGRGRHAHAVENVEAKAARSEAASDKESTTVMKAADSSAAWAEGSRSGVLIRNYGRSNLHMGMTEPLFVKRQIDAYMYDGKIRTAVVINDAASFLQEFDNNPMHTMTVGYERLDSENQNIIVFLYSDDALGNIYKTDTFASNGKDANVINICCPNAAELRNMLMYLHINHGLKIRPRDLSDVALALRQAMSLSEKNIRIKEVYTRLEHFGTDKYLTADECYSLLRVKKPGEARVQLDRLIGMTSVKEALAEYYTDSKPSSVYDFLTASRLQPDKPRPKAPAELMHFALIGNPGTGKTTVAELIGQIFFEMGLLSHGKTLKVTRKDLVGDVVGATALKTQACIDRAIGGVLFIDEAYTLKRDDGFDGDFGQEAIDVLLEQMTARAGDLVVVAAGYPREMETFLAANPGMSSRIRELHIDDYTPEEMCEIVKYQARKRDAVLSEDLLSHLPDFCENWVNLAGENWGNGREAETLIASMLRAHKNDPNKQTQTDAAGKTISVLDTKYIPEDLRENLKPVALMREETLNRLNQMTGLHSVKASVEKLRLRMLSGDMTEPGHYLFTGNPGTGKTTVARYMGQILRNLGMLKRGHVVEYSASSLMSAVFDDKNHGNFEAVANKALDGILFIDEAHNLFTDATARGSSIRAALVTFVENNRKNVSVILAGYDKQMKDLIASDPGFSSRFNHVIHFENYSGEELTSILLDMLKEKEITADDDYKEYALRALTRYVKLHSEDPTFGNARYIRDIFLPNSLDAQNKRLIAAYGEDFPKELKKTLTGKDIPADLVRFTKKPLKQSKNKSMSAMEEIENLIGFEEVKQKLRDLVGLRETARIYGEDLIEDISLHMVLEGNPGTGKTTIAKLVGKVYKELGLLEHGRTSKVTRADLVSGYVGQTAIKTQKCIDDAMGGVLFIDEAYTLKRAGQSGNDYGQEAIDTLLEQMSARNGEFAVIAAGYPKEMNVFLDANPGFLSRFKTIFTLKDYNAEDLLKIFELKCSEKNFHLTDETRALILRLFANMIAARIPNWSNGREAENLEMDMRTAWGRNPVVHKAEGSEEMLRYYTEEHIPEKYRKYLAEKPAASEAAQSGDETQTPQAAAPHMRIPAEELAAPIKDYKYEDYYLDQVKGVVFIRARSGNAGATGSGAIISKTGTIITCNHVIRGFDDIQVRLRTGESGKEETRWVPAEVVWADANLDAAILKIEAGNYPALAIRTPQGTKTGESIYHWGYPFGGRLSDHLDDLQPSLFQGYISSIQTKNGLERINTNMEAKRGCSGGPVFSKVDGRIIGILCGSQTVGDEGLVEEINYVLPIRYLEEYGIIPHSKTTESNVSASD